MSGRALIILLLGVISIASLAFVSISKITDTSNNNMGSYYGKQLAQNISESAMSVALQKLQTTSPWSSLHGNTYTISQLLNGTAAYSFSSTVYSGQNCTRVMSVGVFGLDSAVNVVYVKPSIPSSSLAANVRGAIGAATNIAILGNLTVDGQNHDLSGNIIIGGSGTYAIWTTAAVDFTRGSGEVGGTLYSIPPPDPLNPTGGTDWIPRDRRHYNVNLIQSGRSGPIFPYPDSIFGYPNGTLKNIAKNGGGQYVTDPAELDYPLEGVTYVELPDGGTWENCNLNGTGVLIVHNSGKNARMKNTSGTFKGLVIADDVIHVHSDIIGALVIITTSPTDGNCVGNGSGNILFSRQALTLAQNAALGTANVSDNRLGWWQGSWTMYQNTGPHD